MLNRKADIAILTILFVTIFELLAYFNPVSGEPTLTVKWTYITAAMIISYGLFYCYVRVRNTMFCRKLSEYCNQKNYAEAINLLDRAITKQPKITWLRIQRGIIFGISGKFDSFWAEFNLIYNHEPFSKKNNIFYLSLIAISDGLDFINNTSAKIKLTQAVNGLSVEKYLPAPLLHIYKAIQAYQKNDMKSAVNYAELLCNEDLEFFKLFSSFLLMKAYEKLGEIEKSDICKSIYISNPINFNKYNEE